MHHRCVERYGPARAGSMLRKFSRSGPLVADPSCPDSGTACIPGTPVRARSRISRAHAARSHTRDARARARAAISRRRKGSTRQSAPPFITVAPGIARQNVSSSSLFQRLKTQTCAPEKSTGSTQFDEIRPCRPRSPFQVAETQEYARTLYRLMPRPGEVARHVRVARIARKDQWSSPRLGRRRMSRAVSRRSGAFTGSIILAGQPTRRVRLPRRVVQGSLPEIHHLLAWVISSDPGRRATARGVAANVAPFCDDNRFADRIFMSVAGHHFAMSRASLPFHL